MAEIIAVPVQAKKSRTKIIIVILCMSILLLTYAAGFVGLPLSVLMNYRDKNCAVTLRLHEFYTTLYPGFIQDETLLVPVQECQAYTLAVSNEENGIWGDAYESYEAYVTTYPNGLYVKEAHEHSAAVLMKMIQDQIQQKQYEQALTGLEQIVSNYSDTNTSTDAWTVFPSVYVSWGTSLREAQEFERAEQVFKDFERWSQNNQKTQNETDSQSELAQTYVAWGLTLQSQRQYEDALAKFDLALAADPQSQFDATAQAKTGQQKVYIGWGNDLLEQSEFPAAIQKFKLAISEANNDQGDDAKAALTNGYIRWAQDLSAKEDFRGALEQLNLAKEAARTEDMNQSVDTALQDTYLAFSNSTGSQAQRAIKDALELFCKQHKKPELPIFGLNPDLIHVGLYGGDAQFPESMAVNTPGEMHYVACVTVEKRTVEKGGHLLRYGLPGGASMLAPVSRYRIQIFWNLSLWNMDTGEKVGTKVFAGGSPPPFPAEWNKWADEFYEGPPPAGYEIAEWLQSVVK